MRDYLEQRERTLEARVAVLERLLMTALALHGGEAHTHSEKEWRSETRRALGLQQ